MNPAEAHILKQPEPYKSIYLHLQMLIEHTLPEADLLYKWRMPCYYINKRPLCYINQSKNYVDVGFWHSAHLSKKWDIYLVSEKRKVVKSLRYEFVDDINDSIFISILKEVEGLEEKGFYKKE
ncbi:DUF1801 domain-containing protein [Winogradskyella bathintestinalis]|uniref:DUF1801 domain-containing protein n=1 Tax=Winogradskyella bathintestinalis TaxID=3035208 RepID=A0ABT7ZXN6_9FLAO|nr:DUF1801 domain-containing protein [Winogradskyella bathintestinalis]MDN3493493.1 DUF1801 domain-containing protein [Winogradskyella bathintestinalis]